MLRIEARKSDSVRLVGAVVGSFSHWCGCATKELGFRKCCESKLVRATENSPWREPWGDRQVHEAPARGERSRRRRLPPHPGLSARAFFPWLAPWAILCRPVGLEQRPWVLATHRFTRVPSESAVSPPFVKHGGILNQKIFGPSGVIGRTILAGLGSGLTGENTQIIDVAVPARRSII